MRYKVYSDIGLADFLEDAKKISEHGVDVDYRTSEIIVDDDVHEQSTDFFTDLQHQYNAEPEYR